MEEEEKLDAKEKLEMLTTVPATRMLISSNTLMMLQSSEMYKIVAGGGCAIGWVKWELYRGRRGEKKQKNVDISSC